MLKYFNIRKALNGEAGFTLLEVLMAFVVATIGLVGLALMQGYAVEGNKKGGMYTLATSVAQDRLEAIKNGVIGAQTLTFGQVDMAQFPIGTVLDLGGPDSVDQNGNMNAAGPFTRTWAVTSNTEWSRLITVTVAWVDAGDSAATGGAAPARRVTLTSVSRGAGN